MVEFKEEVIKATRGALLSASEGEPLQEILPLIVLLLSSTQSDLLMFNDALKDQKIHCIHIDIKNDPLKQGEVDELNQFIKKDVMYCSPQLNLEFSGFFKSGQVFMTTLI